MNKINIIRNELISNLVLVVVYCKIICIEIEPNKSI